MFSDMAKGPQDQPTNARSPANVTLRMLHPGRHPAPWGKESRRYEPSVEWPVLTAGAHLSPG